MSDEEKLYDEMMEHIQAGTQFGWLKHQLKIAELRGRCEGARCVKIWHDDMDSSRVDRTVRNFEAELAAAEKEKP